MVEPGCIRLYFDSLGFTQDRVPLERAYLADELRTDLIPRITRNMKIQAIIINGDDRKNFNIRYLSAPLVLEQYLWYI